MNSKQKKEPDNSLVFTQVFNSIEEKICDKNEETIESYIKNADKTLDKIYISNQLFNPDFTLKLLYKKKLENKQKNNPKRKTFNINSISSLNDYFNINKSIKKMIKVKKMKHNNNERNKDKTIFIQKLKILNNNNRNKDILKKEFNTINHYTTKNGDPIKIKGININENTTKNNRFFYTPYTKKIKNINNNDYNIKINKEEEKIINALKLNKLNLLKFHKNKFINEMKREKKLNEIEKQIENKTNTLFYQKEENQNKNNNNNLENNVKSINDEEINSENSKNKKSDKSKSSENFGKLANLNYTIYRNCIKNINFDQNFPDIIKSINKQRLSQFQINNMINRIKNEEDKLPKSKRLLNNQDKEINYHKKELVKREEKEKLYNIFKNEIKERFIHKNLKIDFVSKVSTKLAFFGRQYFFKNYSNKHSKEKDILFQSDIHNYENLKKKKRLKQIKASCNEVISNIKKMEKEKNRVIKRIEKDEEKYNNTKNGYYFSVENKNIINKPIFNISRNTLNNSDNFTYDDKFKNKLKNDKDNKNRNGIRLPKIDFVMEGLSFDQF